MELIACSIASPFAVKSAAFSVVEESLVLPTSCNLDSAYDDKNKLSTYDRTY